VQNVLDPYGGYRMQFYRNFESKAACYEAADAAEAERLSEAVLPAGAAAGSWRCGLRAALGELGRYACERPLEGRGLLVEVRVAEGGALAKRKELFDRLSRAVDSARRETKYRHSLPLIAAEFMIRAIEASVVRSAGER